MKKLNFVGLVLAWWMFGCSSAPSPKVARDTGECVALAAEVVRRLDAKEACDDARSAAVKMYPGCPIPVLCPGDE